MRAQMVVVCLAVLQSFAPAQSRLNQLPSIQSRIEPAIEAGRDAAFSAGDILLGLPPLVVEAQERGAGSVDPGIIVRMDPMIDAHIAVNPDARGALSIGQSGSTLGAQELRIRKFLPDLPDTLLRNRRVPDRLFRGDSLSQMFHLRRLPDAGSGIGPEFELRDFKFDVPESDDLHPLRRP
jgi:hypothetical protein